MTYSPDKNKYTLGMSPSGSLINTESQRVYDLKTSDRAQNSGGSKRNDRRARAERNSSSSNEKNKEADPQPKIKDMLHDVKTAEPKFKHSVLDKKVEPNKYKQDRGEKKFEPRTDRAKYEQVLDRNRTKNDYSD
mmetsp:Transcript_39481/g.37931  ORF Transcript_39481/g.37931 Transcript_39481/m.37931 type:complete len:134 (-) Transcript_39481:169-570(-)